MRVFGTFPTAFNEIKRDLAELSVEVKIQTMQNKQVEGDPNLGTTREVYNYGYTVTRPNYQEVPGVHEKWVELEWSDRLSGDQNPGLSWRVRQDVWVPLAHTVREGPQFAEGISPHFDYTYSDRMGGLHIDRIIEELKTHPSSRQLWLPVWDRQIDEKRRGERRVPCSLGYQFLQRSGAVHITYIMRSCDFALHFPNDVCLAAMLQEHVALSAGFEVGTFTQFIGSFHIYAKDVEGVF